MFFIFGKKGKFYDFVVVILKISLERVVDGLVWKFWGLF